MQNRFINNNTFRYALYIIAVLPIFILRDFTPDNELRYLSIADEALRSGSIFTFTNHGMAYADKPPLYLWIVMLGKHIFGYHNLLFLGIFSYMPALIIVYVMDKWVKSNITESERLSGQLMLLTSGFFVGTAIVIRMDMLMCMFIVLALHTFFRMYSGEGKPRNSWLFPIFVFLAIFTKGPIGFIVPLISTVVFLFLKKEQKSIRKYWGWKTLMILIALCVAWFAGVYVEGGDQYLYNLLFNQTVNRAVSSVHHQEPFYYYLLTIWYSLAPWSLLIIGIWVVGLKKKLVSSDLERFFVVVVLSTFVVLSLFSSKLAVYMLPAFPFLVYLTVLWLAKLDSQKWMLILIGIPSGVLCLALPGVIVVPHFIDLNSPVISPLVFIAALIVSVSGFITLKMLIKKQLNKGIHILGAGMLLAVFTFSFAIPKYNSIIGLKELCDQAKSFSDEKGVANYYYCEWRKGDNLDVYLKAKLEKLSVRDLFETDKPVKKPAILFLFDRAIELNDSLQIFIKDKKIHRSGIYYCVEIEK